LHPEIMNDLPQSYIDLMEKCWNANSLNRPSAEDIAETAHRLLSSLVDTALQMKLNYNTLT
ncbi:19636_t:CDS:2, partial [Cetraspora pellucida]